MPTTTAELLDVLRAFRDQDADGDGNPSNEIPYGVEDSGAGHNARPDIIAGLFGLYSNFGYDNVQLVDDQVSFLKSTDAWKQVLQYMNTMYTEGLLDNEVYTQTSDMSIGKISSGNIGVFGLSSDDLFTTVSDQYVALAPVQSDSGLEPSDCVGVQLDGKQYLYHSCRRIPVGILPPAGLFLYGGRFHDHRLLQPGSDWHHLSAV